jgi:signal transduction histidine kinase
MNKLLSKKIPQIILCILVGQIPPLIFISLDLGELGLEWTGHNAFDIYHSQSIYLFSSIAFPLALGFIFLLYSRIRKQKAFYQSILDGAQEMVVVVDQGYRTIYANAAFKSYGFGIELSGLLQGKAFPLALEYADTINGVQRSLLCSATYAKASGEFTLIFRDITTLKESAEKIKQQEESIMRTSQLASLGEISSGIAHEINNPLGIILANTQILRTHIDAPSTIALKSLDTIDRMGLRITGIIKAMKNLSRTAELTSFERVDLQQVLEDVTNLSLMNFKKSDIQLLLDLATFKDKTVTGSSVQISQVLLNIIGNATQAVAGLDERWVRIELQEDPAFYRLIVQNSGQQIEKQLQEKIFQPFFTTKSPGKGTGLGLSISRTIAEVHKGSLVLDAANEHPTFILSLPRAG